MKNVYVIRLGNLYLKRKEAGILGGCLYKMTDSLDNANFSEDFDSAEKLAEEIGGKAYKINLEEVK
ncbi:hypothetical protein QYM39_06125 [Pediococcus pentosaceus]|uniref:hypothetical protein n=1 Tax=Pediococcus pentosaceus TaxID=1255 RepID=UPI0026585C8D|nr:hypothetical protein [Pediococcus pentosaceus]WKF70483.1 hypothetical protein QYM39_06125 [Pediococcus pentosaceus]